MKSCHKASEVFYRRVRKLRSKGLLSPVDAIKGREKQEVGNDDFLLGALGTGKKKRQCSLLKWRLQTESPV